MAVEIDLAGRVAIVTGAGRGIGREIAAHLARAGADVVVADLDGATAEAAAAELLAEGWSAMAVKVDVRDITQARHVVSATVERFGRLDVLVNNAAVWTTKLFKDTGPEDYERDVGVVLVGTMTMTRAAFDVMREQGGGSIVNMISDSARIGEPFFTVYGAAKGGVMAFTKGLAREAARYGIRVNGVSPAATRTPGSEANIEQWGGEDRIKKLYPLGRLGRPLDHANAILFFASVMSDWVTGQILSVNGGFSMVD